MPWVYTLSLAEFVDPETIQTDWENNIPGNPSVEYGHGGVTVRGTDCVIVSTRNNPDFTEMENFSYVHSISEHKEIPSNTEPMEIGLGIWCEFDNY